MSATRLVLCTFLVLITASIYYWQMPQTASEPSPVLEGQVGGKTSPDGSAEIDCDLPGNLHTKNIASRGLGMCSFVSLHHAATWQNVRACENIHLWMKEKGIPGGGYPKKVEEMITRISQERGMPVPEFLNIESNDLDILKLASRTGRMPCVTYSYSPSGRYGRRRIAHMVNLVYADDKWFCVLDNNYPGEENYEWMTPEEFKRSYTGLGGGWCVIFLDGPPPPPPKN